MKLLTSHLNSTLMSCLPHALHHAAERGHAQQLKKLLEKYSYQRKRVNTLRDHCLMPMELAVAYEHWGCAAILLEAGANPSTKHLYYDQGTLLHTAFGRRSTSGTRLLIVYGADIDVKNRYGKSCRERIDAYPLLKEVFYSSLALKEKLDAAQAQADGVLDVKDYKQAARYLTEIAQYWEALAIAEEMPSLKRHYYQKAVQKLEEAHSYAQGDELSDHIFRLQEELARLENKPRLKAHITNGLFSKHYKVYRRLEREPLTASEHSPLLRQ